MQQLCAPMLRAPVARQLQGITLSTFASKPNSLLRFNSKDRLLGAGHHVWETQIQSKKSPCFAPFGEVHMFLHLPKTGSSPQTPQQAGDVVLTMVVSDGLSFPLLQKALKYFDQMRHFQKCWRADGM